LGRLLCCLIALGLAWSCTESALQNPTSPPAQNAVKPHAPDLTNPASIKRLIITIDVEAHRQRQETEHVQRLIWGRFGEHELGIRRMMQIAESYGVPLTFFVDYCETVIYPGSFEEITACIVERGHDVQVHAHPDVWPPEFWATLGFSHTRPATSLNLFNREQAEVLMSFLLSQAAACGAPTPVAFRGGAFRYNADVLQAMANHGLILSFNYSTGNPHQSNNQENLPLFQWSNGVYEVPLTCVRRGDRLCPLEFNSPSLRWDDPALIRDDISAYFREFGPDAVMVLLMHSWSLCVRDPSTGYFYYEDDRLANAFGGILANLPADVRVITARQLAAEIRSGQLRPSMVRDLKLAEPARHSSVHAVASGPSQAGR